MKYMTEETLNRMLRILSENKVLEYQNASATYDVYGKDPMQKIYVNNSLKMDILRYCLAVNDCIATLFYQLDFDEIDNMLSNEQLINDIEYFQSVYREDICKNN